MPSESVESGNELVLGWALEENLFRYCVHIHGAECTSDEWYITDASEMKIFSSWLSGRRNLLRVLKTNVGSRHEQESLAGRYGRCFKRADSPQPFFSFTRLLRSDTLS